MGEGGGSQKFFRPCGPQFGKNKGGGLRALGVLLKVLSASYQVSHTKLNKVSKERQGPLATCPSCKEVSVRIESTIIFAICAFFFLLNITRKNFFA